MGYRFFTIEEERFMSKQEKVLGGTGNVLQPEVLILGGGATGTGTLRDLALRGVQCLLVEAHDINAGASGANHGLLHSGARYVASDMEAARECRDESDILRKMAPQCIEDTGGLFVAVAGDDEGYISKFPELCHKAGIFCEEVPLPEARAMEPALAKDIIAAYALRDGGIDPFMLALDNVAQAESLGAEIRRNATLLAFEVDEKRVVRVCFVQKNTGKEFIVEPQVVINAAGAWAGEVAGKAGCHVNLSYSAGTMLITQSRLTTKVVNRLRKPGNGDILVPGGTVSILGTTSVRLAHPNECRPTRAECFAMVDDARAMIPALETARYIRAYAGVRPLVRSQAGSDDRKLSRGFSLLDHMEDGVDNFVSIAGGKLTTYRLMAEKTADLVCKKLGKENVPCTTATTSLPASEQGKWTEPLRSPLTWLEEKVADDFILCECEMVSKSTVDNIAGYLQEKEDMSVLQAIGNRSRSGKGCCQGCFCGLRMTSRLYNTGLFTGRQGLTDLRQFVQERWKGHYPVLWGHPLAQADLQEAIYCGMLCLELPLEETLRPSSCKEVSKAHEKG